MRPLQAPVFAIQYRADATQADASASTAADPIYNELAKLDPPRKHYQKYYATPEANEDMWHAPQGVHNFLRAYYHMKSADRKQNAPFPLKARTASEWAKLPRYYIMDLDKGMAETVATAMPSDAAIAACKWLPDNELRVYSAEYERTGSQGGLEEYRVRWIDKCYAELRLFSGRTIDVPSLFIAGRSDWGVYQNPGDAEDGVHPNAGHSSRRRSWALGTARTTRGSVQVAASVSAAKGVRVHHHREGVASSRVTPINYSGRIVLR